MKKLVWVLLIFTVATAIKQIYDHFNPMAEAYRAYREEARRVALGRENDPAFRDIEGNIVDVVYRLVSAEPAGDGHVRLIVTEAIHFQRFSESGPFGNRRVAETRRDIVLAKVSGTWTVTEMSEDSMEIRELSAVDLAND